MNRLPDKPKVAWLSFWAILATVLLFFPVMISALLSSTGNLPFSISRVWAWIMFKAIACRVSIRGRERIRKGQSYVIVSNHQSQVDILALVTCLGIQFRWVIKKELLKLPLFGYALYASRNIFIDRSNPDQAMKSVRQGMERLPPGTSVLFFAEGTRSPDGRIQEFKKGAFVAALEAGLPILPVTVNGSRKILPKRSLAFQPGRVEVVVGGPISPQGFSRDHLDELVGKTRDVIISQFVSG